MGGEGETMANNKYIADRQTFINKETGEEVSGLLKIEPVERDKFDIIYLMRFADIFDLLGGVRYKILKYLLTHRSSENTLIITQRQLAKEVGCSLPSVTETLGKLKEANIIKTVTGAIIINPQVLVHGSKKKEDWIFTKFVSFDKETKEE